VKTSFAKIEPTSQAKILRQPIFSNPLVTNYAGRPLRVSGLSERRTIAKAGCTRIRDLWDQENKEWKSLLALGMSSHVINEQAGTSSSLTSFGTQLHFPMTSKLGTGSTTRQRIILPLSHGSIEWQKFSQTW